MMQPTNPNKGPSGRFARLTLKDRDPETEDIPPCEERWCAYIDSVLEPEKPIIDNIRWLPFSFLSAIAFISWISTAILLFYVIARSKRIGSRVGRYIFRIVALIIVIFAPVFYLGWNRLDQSFHYVDETGWGIGTAALVVAHINLFIGILLALLAAISDAPRDFPPDPPSGTTTPTTRRGSRTTGGSEA
ncbi:hypothetical protein FALBO_6729 [Fusarium albosuccineum]|uniref:Uncharacterized protein n=1 Tax=Fusarium albosuccineum TaxID=1237068 RepID=A0A8H4LEV6_9HYPO|nr:hypothetical protein FALBO_6729 [Fusarium albosuccineum]